MQKITTILLLICTLFVACKREGTKFTKYTNSSGPKAEMGDFITLNLQYATENDSTIFSSYDKPRPLSFKLQPTLFKGLLNDGLLQMAAGDSASFLVPADSLYGARRPKFMKEGAKIKYTVSVKKVQSQAEYMEEKQKEKAARGLDTSRVKQLSLPKGMDKDKLAPKVQVNESKLAKPASPKIEVKPAAPANAKPDGK